MIYSSIGLNVALVVLLSISINQKSNLNEYAQHHLQNNITEIGKQLQILNMDLNKINIESLDKEEFDIILKSYTTFAYEFVALERIGETLEKVPNEELNHSAIFKFKNQLHVINNRFSEELSVEDKQFFNGFKSFINDLNEDLNNNFQIFQIQEFIPVDETYKVEIEGNKEITDFDYELKIINDYWIDFIRDVSRTNSNYLK